MPSGPEDAEAARAVAAVQFDLDEVQRNRIIVRAEARPADARPRLAGQWRDWIE